MPLPRITYSAELIYFIKDDGMLEDIEEHFEEDMDHRNYKPYVEKYPDRVYEIFAGLFAFGDPSLITKEDIQYFIEHGVDLNQKVRCDDMDGLYPGEYGNVTPLLMCAEFKWTDTMELLLQFGADPYICDGKYNMLSNFLRGWYYRADPNVHQSFIHKLNEYCNVCSLSISKSLINIREKEIGDPFAPFIQEILAKCTIIDDTN